MEPEKLLNLLEENGIETVDNQACIDGMNQGYETASLLGSPPGAEGLIAGAFTESMPDANPSQDITAKIQNTVTFNLPEMS